MTWPAVLVASVELPNPSRGMDTIARRRRFPRPPYHSPLRHESVGAANVRVDGMKEKMVTADG